LLFSLATHPPPFPPDRSPSRARISVDPTRPSLVAPFFPDRRWMIFRSSSPFWECSLSPFVSTLPFHSKGCLAPAPKWAFFFGRAFVQPPSVMFLLYPLTFPLMMLPLFENRASGSPSRVPFRLVLPLGDDGNSSPLLFSPVVLLFFFRIFSLSVGRAVSFSPEAWGFPPGRTCH